MQSVCEIFSHAHISPANKELNGYTVRFKLDTAVFVMAMVLEILVKLTEYKKVSSNHRYSLAHLGGGGSYIHKIVFLPQN